MLSGSGLSSACPRRNTDVWTVRLCELLTHIDLRPLVDLSEAIGPGAALRRYIGSPLALLSDSDKSFRKSSKALPESSIKFVSGEA